MQVSRMFLVEPPSTEVIPEDATDYEIFQAACRASVTMFGQSPVKMVVRRARKAELTMRCCVCRSLREFTDYSYPELAILMGYSDHSSIHYLTKKDVNQAQCARFKKMVIKECAT